MIAVKELQLSGSDCDTHCNHATRQSGDDAKVDFLSRYQVELSYLLVVRSQPSKQLTRPDQVYSLSVCTDCQRRLNKYNIPLSSS